MSAENPPAAEGHDCPGLKACPSCYAAYLEAWEREHGPVEKSVVGWRVPTDSTTADELRDSAADIAAQILNMPGSDEQTAKAIDTFLKMMTLHSDTRYLYGNGTAALRLHEAAIEAEMIDPPLDPHVVHEVIAAAMRYEDFPEPSVPEEPNE